MNMRILVVSLLVAFLAPFVLADEISPGVYVRLGATSDLGVPLHARPGENAVSARLADQCVAEVIQCDAPTTWVQIKHGDVSGWIIRRYIVATEPAPAPAAPSPENAEEFIVIGAWNLEHFGPNKQRGFPENTKGGPTYPSRTAADLQRMADIIKSLQLRILVLEEIDAAADPGDGETQTRSAELDKLIAALGTEYEYYVGSSGGSQHIALLYDTRCVRLNATYECSFPEKTVQKKSLFDRQPLMGHFSILANGSTRNDLLVVGVHLASGQQLTQNHNEAMTTLVDSIDEQRQDEIGIPADEHDVVIMGDFNANRFDSYQETFWDTLDQSSWDVLADDSSTYPATRLSGCPLELRDSKIDYIIVTRGNGGLQGDEVTVTTANVHTELVRDDAEAFRAYASDHLPVTIPVRITDDNDAN